MMYQIIIVSYRYIPFLSSQHCSRKKKKKKTRRNLVPLSPPSQLERASPIREFWLASEISLRTQAISTTKQRCVFSFFLFFPLSSTWRENITRWQKANYDLLMQELIIPREIRGTWGVVIRAFVLLAGNRGLLLLAVFVFAETKN